MKQVYGGIAHRVADHQHTGDRGTVIDRRGVNLDDAVAHTQLTKLSVVDASVEMHVVLTFEMQPRTALDTF